MIKKPLIGLLGGPGSGKSTVAGCFAELGYGVVNADQLNHTVLARPDIVRQLAEIFGTIILDDCGNIDRKALSAIVFSSKDGGNLHKLVDVVHPEVFKLMEAEIAGYEKKQQVCGIVLDIPLLLEVGLEKRCDYLIFVSVEDRIRRRRLVENRNWDENLIKNIENSQIFLDKKREISDYIVENSSDISDLRRQVEEISPKMLQK